jgi:dihydroflavonol-4-reductase
LDGQPGVLNINSGFVDARDVADLHVRAMIDVAAKGERFLAVAGESMWMIDVAKVLRDHFGAAASKVSTHVMPDADVAKNPAMKGLVSLLGVNMNATSAKAKRLLGWNPRSREEAIISSADSLMRLGLL